MLLVPSFKSDTLNIVNFGAIPNTGKLCMNAINDTIKKGSESDGGVVVILPESGLMNRLKMK